MSTKHYYQVRIENKNDPDDVISVISGKDKSAAYRVLEKSFNNDFVIISEGNLPKNIKLYHIIEAEYTPKSASGRWTKTLSSYGIKKADIKTLDYIEVDGDKYWRLISKLDIHYYEIAKGRGLGLQLFISKQSKEIIDKAISTEQEPLVIKGTDFPYWFEVNGQLLPSQEKNWFLYLYNEFAIIDKSMLETLKKEPTKKA